MNETYLNYLKVEFCRYYELSPEYIEKFGAKQKSRDKMT